MVGLPYYLQKETTKFQQSSKCKQGQERVDFGGGKIVDYVYDAAGTRLRKVVTNGSTVTTYDYLDGFVYTNSTLAYFSMAEGRVRNAGGTKVYEYFIKDQLGNVRVSFEDNGSGVAKVVQENHYYPFGLTMQGVANRTAVRGNANKQLYNAGSELQDDFGFESSYSTFFREYDQALGRFMAIDPKADKFSGWSPYNFAFNDPANLNDPLGDEGSPSGPYTNTTLPQSMLPGPTSWQPGFSGFFFYDPAARGNMTFAEEEWYRIATAPGGWNQEQRMEQFYSQYTGSSGEYYNRIGQGLSPQRASSNGSNYSTLYNGVLLKEVSIISGNKASIKTAAWDAYMQIMAHRLRVYEGKNIYSGDNIFLKTYQHYQIGGGEELIVSTSALDLNGISMRTKEIQAIVSQGRGMINLFTHMKNQTGLAIGSVQFNYIGNNTFHLSTDIYDFDIRWRDGNTTRNWATFAAGLIHGPVIDNLPLPIPGPSTVFGGTYRIRFIGTVTLKN